jgi:hypothetical protein
MADELERIWKKAAMTYERYHLEICLERARKNHEKLRITNGPAEIRTALLTNTSLLLD